METGKDSVACGLFRRGPKTIWQLRGRKGTVYARCVVRLDPLCAQLKVSRAHLHFSTFIRKKTGRTPCDIRHGQQIPRNAWTPVRTKASIGLSEH